MTPDEWYRRAFGRFYLEVYAHRDDGSARAEAAFAARALGIISGVRVLDLACGTGRHARPLAALGARVAGVDLSPHLLAEAARHGSGPTLARADMRALPFRAVFDAVCLFFTSFGYFDEPAQDERVLAEVARVLRPGGGLLLDLPNRVRVIGDLVPESEDLRKGFRVLQSRRMTGNGRRVEKRVRVFDDAGRPAAHWTESVRLYAPEEIEAMLRAGGFAVEARYGDLSGAAFGEAAARFVTVSRKAR
jgi:SAM-dependent methyltransferase